MRFEEIQMKIGVEGPDVQVLFSRNVKDIRMTPNEAERYAYEMLDAVKQIRQTEAQPTEAAIG
jgi:hypothetical protein